MKNKKLVKIFALLVLISSNSFLRAQMKVGDNPTTINSNSVLEMESTNKGMLLPRLALTNTTSATPLSAHVQGMVVYNTATAGDVTPGYYYNDGAKWNKISTPSAANNTTASSLITISNGTGATFTAMVVGVDTTALKTFLNNKIQVSTTSPITGNGTTSNPIGVTRANTTAGQLITITNGTNATFTAMVVDVDTTALKTFINSSVGKTTTGGNLITVTNGIGAALKDNTVGVDTAALKTFLNNKIQVSTAAPVTGNGTSANPITVTTGDLTAGSLLQTTGTPSAALLKTAGLQVDTANLKTFLTGKVSVIANAPITGNGTNASPLGVTQNSTTAGPLVNITNGTNATFTAMTVAVDTTALKTFINNKTTNTLTGTSNNITSTVNGVAATVTPAAGTVTTKFLGFDASGNLVTDTANTGTTNTLTNPTNTITSTVNGVVATTTAVNSVSNTFTPATRSLTTTVNGVAGTAVTLTDGPDSTTASNGLTMTGKDVRLGGNLTSATTVTTSGTNTLAVAGLQSGSSGDSIIVADPSTGVLKRVSPRSLLATSTTDTLNSSGNIMTSKVNGVQDTALIINNNTLSTATNTMTSNVNGVSSNTSIINSNTITLTVDTLTTAVNGIVSNKVGISSIEPWNSTAINKGAKSNTDSVYIMGKVGVNTTTPNSYLTVNGSIATAARKVTSATSLGLNDFTVLANCTAGGLTITLPAASSCDGRMYRVGKSDVTSNVLTFSQSIFLAETVSFTTLNYNRMFTIQAIGGQWWVINQQ